MKIAKMSLAAAILLGASAFAIENTKVSGDLKLYYYTDDAYVADPAAATGEKAGTLFDKGNSAGDAALNVGITSDLATGISAGAKLTSVATLGLENNLVGKTWGNSHSFTAGNGANFLNGLGGVQVENASWVSEAWVAASVGKTTAKVGRMALDTPLLFSETWTVESNTFEGAVVLNQDIPDTTIVAAWVGTSNGAYEDDDNTSLSLSTLGLAVGGTVATDGDFDTFYLDGAYAAAVINNSWKPLTAQAWYYDVQRVAQAYWLQADLALDFGLELGAQYSAVDFEKAIETALVKEDSDVFAVKAGYTIMDGLSVAAAYSQTAKKYNGWGTTISGTHAASKLYTEAWWNYGYVTGADTSAITVTAAYSLKDMADFGLYITSSDQAGTVTNPISGAQEHANNDMMEVTATAGTNVGPLGVTLAYVYTDANDQNVDPVALQDGGRAYNSVQVYLDASF